MGRVLLRPGPQPCRRRSPSWKPALPLLEVGQYLATSSRRCWARRTSISGSRFRRIWRATTVSSETTVRPSRRLTRLWRIDAEVVHRVERGRHLGRLGPQRVVVSTANLVRPHRLRTWGKNPSGSDRGGGYFLFSRNEHFQNAHTPAKQQIRVRPSNLHILKVFIS